MSEISIKELNAHLDETLRACSSIILNEPDEILERWVFEEFDVGVTSFLDQSSLERLSQGGFITTEIKALCEQLRQKATVALENDRSVADVRGGRSWQVIRELSDRIQRLKANLEQTKK